MEKDFFKRVCCLALLWLSTLCLNVVHASTLIDGLYYDLDTSNRTATVTYETTGSNNYASLPADVVIPENVTYWGITYSVTKIGAQAFQNCSSITEVTVGKELKNIGARAFLNCKSFTAMLLPDEFTTMGEVHLKVVLN